MFKRGVSLCCALVALFFAVAGRMGYITLSGAYSVAEGYNSYTMDISRLYMNIYSSDNQLLNNNTKSVSAIIRPNEKCLSELNLLFNTENAKEITNELKKGYPIVRKIDKYSNTKYIKTIELINENSDDMLCRHMIDKACGGLEQYTDKEIGRLSINFSVDAVGRVLNGDTGKIINDNYDSTQGVTVSINSKIQRIAEEACKNMKEGSLVVLDADTSQILASVSKGEGYLNKSLSSYAVGSVFKLIICATALENNINPSFDCKSEIKVGDTVFHCQNNKEHKKQTMKEALANSCNCYFVNLALMLGKDKIVDTATKFGYCKDYHLYNNMWLVKASAFPSKESLEESGQLALLGFGQGQLTDTPVHFASVTACIANGGNYTFPTLNNNANDNKSERAISEKTAQKLREYMRYAVTNGTALNAQYKGKTAGKTATAQSGVYADGKELLNTWFAGFYPYEKPKYAVVVMTEGGNSGAEDCCPIFRTLVEMLEKM